MAQFEELEPAHAAAATQAFAAQPESPIAQPPKTQPTGPLGGISQGISNVLGPIGRAVNATPVVGPISRAIGAGAPASMAVPGGPLAQAAIQPAAAALQSGIGSLGKVMERPTLSGLVTGEQKPGLKEAALDAGKAALGAEAGTLGGLGAGKAIKAVASPLLHRVASNQKAEELAKYLSEKVPAWTKFGSDEAALSKMLKSQRGYNSLHRAYDDTLKGVVAKAEGQRITLPMEDAKALGIKEVFGSKDPAVTDVEVDAAKAAKAVMGKWKDTPGLYRRVSQSLDEKGIGDPAGRAAYKTGIGAREFVNKSKSVESGKFNLFKSQQGLENDKTGDLLRRRQLGDVEGILRGGVKTGSEPVGGRKPITRLDPKAHGGFFGLKPPIPSFYGNVPSGPLARTAGQIIPRAGAAAGPGVAEQATE